MWIKISAALLALGIYFTGIDQSKVSFSVPHALADDDDGGFRGGGFRGGGFSGGRFILGMAPRIFRGIRLSGRRAGKRYASRRRDRSRPVYAAQSQQPASSAQEIVAVGLTSSDIDRLKRLGFNPVAERQIGAFGTSLTRLEIPERQSLKRALAIVSNEVPGAAAAGNDRYRGLSRVVYEPAGAGCGVRCEAFELTSWTSDLGSCTAKSKIGVVDTAADLTHPSLAGTRIISKTFRSQDRVPSDTDHGTAVLSLLVGKPDSDVVGLAHGAEVFHADAFHGKGDASTTDVFDLVGAIDWLIEENVGVMNLSFSGPDNPLVERVIQAAQNKGVHIIAAVGRPDRGSLAGYPARYTGVIAVSAVDSRLRPSRLSLRGGHVSFAAPGVGLTVANGKDGLRRVDGTSFATPFVVAAYAMSTANGTARADTSRTLARTAQDLGAPGRDPVYGWGLLKYSGLPGC